MNESYAVITGCNRGIGKATLEVMASKGYNIIAVVRKETEEFQKFTSQIEKSNNINIITFTADFSNEQEVKECAKKIASTKKNISVLINNIGVALPQKSMLMTKLQIVKDVFQINLFSSILFTQVIARTMINKGGSIIYVSSTSAFDGGGNIEYSSSKAAIIGLVHRLALEFGKHNIRVNAIAPGLTKTDMAKTLSDDDVNKTKNLNVLMRLGKPKEIANAIWFLASDYSSFITGQTLRVDGGLR